MVKVPWGKELAVPGRLCCFLGPLPKPRPPGCGRPPGRKRRPPGPLRAGARLEFISFDWEDTPKGRVFYAVRGAVAEYEREKIRERTTLGRLQKARQGGIPVGFDVYGYTYDPETGRVEIKEDEAAVVREIFERFAAGWGYNTIARWLNEQGIPTRRRKGAWRGSRRWAGRKGSLGGGEGAGEVEQMPWAGERTTLCPVTGCLPRGTF